MHATEAPERARITVAQFQRMGEAGVFDAEDRIELVDGELFRMAPIGPPHAASSARLNLCFSRAIGERALLVLGAPVTLGRHSQLQPDLMLLRPRSDFYARRHPVPADVLLMVEVSDCTLAFDTGRKLALYASHGIAEYWIIDIGARAVRVHRAPRGERYESVELAAPPARIAPLALPEAVVEVQALLP